MHNLVLFLAGLVTVYAGGAFAVMSVFDTSGRRWVTVLGGFCAVLAVAGLLLAVRAVGIGWVGAP
jgi:hypothetical protein